MGHFRERKSGGVDLWKSENEDEEEEECESV